ncbi:hypothetical protein ACQEU5_03675 [Marinactinospora thermotolerans]|uniref:Uncharacterized protein n=1 Tax=Marinactinospora thermotolerans DSM 45154 TaxID=1122192 RepID=A0A1T4TC80_9ACTN|nr:hypothetical protein [Marinactinospora thermotolerans]SKA38007.1 hypothetical protein SAMN02745673_04773 [Marinactinospora thermotolerans DSM 45154]
MKLTMLCKDQGSGGEGCPSVYLADTGELVVQGAQLSHDDLSSLENPLPGETAVRIAPEIVIEAIRRYQARG